MTSTVPTQYAVSAIPAGHPDRFAFAVQVEYRTEGHGWAITRPGACLSSTQEWDEEVADPTPEWLRSHRFPFVQAMRRAREIAPTLTVKGRTVADMLKEH